METNYRTQIEAALRGTNHSAGSTLAEMAYDCSLENCAMWVRDTFAARYITQAPKSLGSWLKRALGEDEAWQLVCRREDQFCNDLVYATDGRRLHRVAYSEAFKAKLCEALPCPRSNGMQCVTIPRNYKARKVSISSAYVTFKQVSGSEQVRVIARLESADFESPFKCQVNANYLIDACPGLSDCGSFEVMTDGSALSPLWIRSKHGQYAWACIMPVR